MTTLELSADVAEKLVSLAGSPDANLAIGSTWLLKAFLEDGERLDPVHVDALAGSLASVEDDWARLHICQSLRFLDIPADRARDVAAFLEGCLGSEQKFVRAWVIDGFWRLALQHERFLAQALELVGRGERDPAASVRARACNLRREADRIDR